MLLVLFRHGDSEDFGADGTDASRCLTAHGQRENAASIRAIRRAGVRPDAIIHSPLVRAAQTAHAAAEVLQPPQGLRADGRLAGGADLQDVADMVVENPAEGLMLVGHNPDLALIAGALIGSGAVAMKTSGVACIDLPAVEPGMGRLEWLIRP